MSSNQELSERVTQAIPVDFSALGAQLSEMLGKFNDLSAEMASQRRIIDQLVTNNSGSDPTNPVPVVDHPPEQVNQLPLTSNVPTISLPPLTNPIEEFPVHFNHDLLHTRPNFAQTNPPNYPIPQSHPQINPNILPNPQAPHHHAAEPFVWDVASQGRAVIDEIATPIDKDLLKRLDRFEEFMKKSQGLHKHGGLDYDDLCLFPDVQLPLGFKAPKFTKYDGTGNPKTHLKMFANKLGKPVNDENLPMRLFPESLEGDALDWYSNLKPQEIRTWLDLSTAFVKQYEFNCELAPTRTTLESTKRKPSEDHKTYAKRWRKLAAKVEPPMGEEEIVRTFIKAHEPPYFEEIFRMTGSSFAAIINKLEEYDEFVKARKIVNVTALKLQLEALQNQNQNNNGKKAPFKKKEGETAFVWDQGPSFRPKIQNRPSYAAFYPQPVNPQPIYHTNTLSHYPQSGYPNFPPPFSTPRPTFQNYPRPHYNPRPPQQNNIHVTPNPFQANQNQIQRPPRTYTNLGRPIDQLYEQLKAAGKIGVIPAKVYNKGLPAGYNPQAICAYHSGSPGHFTANCWALKNQIQDMIESGEIVLRRRGEQGPNVNKNPLPEHENTVGAITVDEEFDDPASYIVDEYEIENIMGDNLIKIRNESNVENTVVKNGDAVLKDELKQSVFEKDEPFVLEECFDPFVLDVPPFEWDAPDSVVLEFPEQMPVNNLQEVPWNYEEPVLLIGDKKLLKEEVSAVTRSGRVLGDHEKNDPLKIQENSVPPKQPVSEKEALDFLRLIKRSEYKIVEQLDKAPAHISFLNLLLTSEPHREVLLKVLNEAQIPKDVPVDKFSGMVGNILASNCIRFSDDDLTAEGIGHNRALYISVRCNGKLLPRVLVDNGSALNICPWGTLVRLGLSDTKLRPSTVVVRGFDGTRREPMGEIDLVLEVGPAQFQIPCQVMDFSGAYNVLLGRPWIHTSNLVPSSLHQVLKFVINNQLITVFAEDDCAMMVNANSKGKDSGKISVSAHRVEDVLSAGQIFKTESFIPETSVMMAKEMIRGGYEIGKGLGRNLQGLLKPIELPTQKDTFGLGFLPTARDRKEMKARKIAEKEGKLTELHIPPLHYSFARPSGEMMSNLGDNDSADEILLDMSQLFVGVISDAEPSGSSEFPTILKDGIQNWTADYLPSRREFR